MGYCWLELVEQRLAGRGLVQGLAGRPCHKGVSALGASAGAGPCPIALHTCISLHCSPTCHPAARRPPQVCEDCPNVKLEREPEVLTISVEPGMPDGHEIVFFEEGAWETGARPGQEEGGLRRRAGCGARCCAPRDACSFVGSQGLGGPAGPRDSRHRQIDMHRLSRAMPAAPAPCRARCASGWERAGMGGGPAFCRRHWRLSS